MRRVSVQLHEISDRSQRRPVGAGDFLFLVSLALLTTASNAFAYLDPGTGSILLQAVIGGGMAAAYFLRKHWQSLRNRLSGRPTDADRPRSDAPEAR